MIRTSLALAAALVAAPAAHAQVFKCIDGDRTVYSQTPCPSGAQSTTIRRSGPTTPPPGDAKGGGAPKSAAEQEQAFRKRQQDQAKAQKKEDDRAAESQEKQQRCESSRSQLAQYEQGGRISRIDANGERYLLDDNQIAQETARARAQVDQWCR